LTFAFEGYDPRLSEHRWILDTTDHSPPEVAKQSTMPDLSESILNVAKDCHFEAGDNDSTADGLALSG